MNELIDLKSFPIQKTLKILLKDKTTKKNIIWATDSYKEYGSDYDEDKQITPASLNGLNSMLLQPRIMKQQQHQAERTKTHAEVFTPSWVCNQMNNYCDEEWFGRKNVFNTQTEQSWTSSCDKITFPKNKTWQKYVDSRRLEITCGEAAYIVSRYDTSTGQFINISDRIGILDRKLRIVNENTNDENEWLKWTIRAFQSVYGYEYIGDSVLISRINLLMTFIDYMVAKYDRQPTVAELRKVANIIAWNVWQMDGLTGTIPFGIPEENTQCSIDGFTNEIETESKKITPKCRIYDWRANESISYESLKGGKKYEV